MKRSTKKDTEKEEKPNLCCPKCGERLVKTGHTRMAGWEEYWRCPAQHQGVWRHAEEKPLRSHPSQLPSWMRDEEC